MKNNHLTPDQTPDQFAATLLSKFEGNIEYALYTVNLLIFSGARFPSETDWNKVTKSKNYYVALSNARDRQFVQAEAYYKRVLSILHDSVTTADMI